MTGGDGAATARSLEIPGPFRLDSGESLPSVTVAYRTWGRLDEDGTNAVLVCHALTGSPDVAAWWGPLLGEGRALDPRGRGGWREALASVRVPALVVAIDSDVLYPPVEPQELAEALPFGRLATLRSPHGHDAFLIEAEAVNALVAEFREETAAELGAAAAPSGREEASWAC